MAIRAVLASLIWIGVVGALATPAVAGTVEVQPEKRPYGVVDSLVFHARPGERNDLTLTYAPDFVRLEDAAGVTPGDGCVRDSGVPETVVLCSPGLPASAFLYLGDGDDHAEVGLVTAHVELSGGTGNDWLGSASSHNRFVGGTGNDVMVGVGGTTNVFDEGKRRNGSDSMSGILGPRFNSWVDYGQRRTPVHADLDDDRDDGERGERDLLGDGVTSIRGGSAPDRLVGNGADNNLIGGAASDLLSGREGNDVLVATRVRREGLTGDGVQGDTSDRLLGGGGADLLEGSLGGNLLSGGPGGDIVWGAGGSDRLRERDGSVDEIRCGGGGDRIREDRIDFQRSCEHSAFRTSAALPLSVYSFIRDRSPEPRVAAIEVACSGIRRSCAGSVTLELDGQAIGETRFAVNLAYGDITLAEIPVSREVLDLVERRDPRLSVVVTSRNGREVSVGLTHLPGERQGGVPDFPGRNT